MSLEGVNGILNVESAALHAPQVGVANTNPQHILSVGSNLYVSGDSSDVLTIDGNVVCEGVKVGLIEIIPSYDLAAVANVGNVTQSTIQFANAVTGFVTTSNIEVGTANLFVDTVSGRVGIGKTDPGATLDVQGDVEISSNLAVDTNTLFVDSVGNNVGIGTTAPFSTLTIMSDDNNAATSLNPSAQLVLATTGTDLDDDGDVGASLVFTQRWYESLYPNEYMTTGSIHGYKNNGQGNYGGGLIFKTQPASAGTPSEIMRITADGNVGIGAIDPQHPLHVVGTASHILEVQNTGDTARMKLNGSSGTGGDLIFQQNGTSTWGIASIGDKLHFLGDDSTSQYRMTIDNDGDVGIGTTDPDVKFQVEGTSSSHQKLTKLATWNIFHHRDDGSFEHLITYSGSDGQSYFDNRDNFMYVQIPAVGGETLYTSTVSGYNSGYFKAKFRDLSGNKPNLAQNTTYKVHAYSSRINAFGYMTTSGRVGIGTTNPVAKLTLNAYGNESTTDCFFIGANTGSQNLRLGVNSADQYCWIQSHAGKPLRLNPAGNLVQYGTANTTLSDDRIKDNEVYIENATDTLLKLKPQVYDKKLIWNISKLGETSNTSIVRESGLITQDVWYDAPELRHLVQLGEGAEPGDDKPYTDNDPTNDPDYSSWGDNVSLLDYTGLIPYLIKSNQELHTELQTVKARLDTLEGA